MSFEVTNKILTEEILNNKVTEELKKTVTYYKKNLKYMAADAPIEVLCLPKRIENCLNKAGCIRIYDIFDLDLTKIKGLGNIGCRDLTSALDQFLAMSI